jgi:hypothetical protein
MTDRATIYVPLIDEGVEVWRPVQSRRLSADTYLILNQEYDRNLESWAFEPGTVVRCQARKLNGQEILVASEVAYAAAVPPTD